MLKKRLGLEAVERDSWGISEIGLPYKIHSTLVIPEGCKKIGTWAFWCCDNLKEVVIPESVKEIEDYAFRVCCNLEKVVIPESVEWIGERAFLDCEKLEKVVIPKSVNVIDYSAFCGCRNAEVILEKPKSEFKYIGENAFENCKSVKYAEEEAGS